MQYSVVVPVQNEQAAISELLSELQQVMDGLHVDYELIVVNDGSTDATAEILAGLLREGHLRLRVLSSSSRLGQSAALLSGFHAAQAQVLITLDGDGQNDPHDIPRMLPLLNNYDMVIGLRTQRRDRWSKRTFSRVANWLRNKLTRSIVPDSGCGLKVFHRRCLESHIPFCGYHRFMTALVELHAGQVISLPVTHRERIGGRSHYGIFDRLLPSLLDGLAIAWLIRRRVEGKQTHAETLQAPQATEDSTC